LAVSFLCNRHLLSKNSFPSRRVPFSLALVDRNAGGTHHHRPTPLHPAQASGSFLFFSFLSCTLLVIRNQSTASFSYFGDCRPTSVPSSSSPCYSRTFFSLCPPKSYYTLGPSSISHQHVWTSPLAGALFQRSSAPLFFIEARLTFLNKISVLAPNLRSITFIPPWLLFEDPVYRAIISWCVSHQSSTQIIFLSL